MITVKVHTAIGSEEERMFYSMFSIDNEVFSLDSCQQIIDSHPNEKDFTFNLHCPGGSVSEGLAIYDYLRTSGKNIYMNIEGACHSMAIVLLLAAPKNQRSANPNCKALIHKVSGGYAGSTADELEAAAQDIRRWQNDILNIYADRTDLPFEELESIMNEEQVRSAQDLLDWGFIGKINSYNTNYKQTTITMKGKDWKQRASNFLTQCANFFGAMNFEFVDAEGAVLFTTDAEDDTLEVGMKATPDGTYTINDGRVVTIEEGAITKIEDPAPAPTPEEVNELKNQNAEYRKQLAEAVEIINEYRKNQQSNYVPNGRIGSAATSNKGKGGSTSEERKAAIREKMNK